MAALGEHCIHYTNPNSEIITAIVAINHERKARDVDVTGEPGQGDVKVKILGKNLGKVHFTVVIYGHHVCNAI